MANALKRFSEIQIRRGPEGKNTDIHEMWRISEQRFQEQHRDCETKGKKTFNSEGRQTFLNSHIHTHTYTRTSFSLCDMRLVFGTPTCLNEKKGKVSMCCYCVCTVKKSITGNSTPTSCFEKLLCSTVTFCSGSHQQLAGFSLSRGM